MIEDRFANPYLDYKPTKRDIEEHEKRMKETLKPYADHPETCGCPRCDVNSKNK